MAEDRQPQSVVEGAVGDVEDEIPAAKSAEDRKAAAALSSMDTTGDDDESGAKDIDQDAVNRAMTGSGKTGQQKDVSKVKVTPASVSLVMTELELSKPRATDLLKRHQGDPNLAMSAYLESE